MTDASGLTRKLELAGVTLYAIVDQADDGRPCRIQLYADRPGQLVRGLATALADLATLALERGAPIEDVIRVCARTRFEPSGLTGDPEIRSATSILDMLAQWLERRFAQPAECGER